MGRARGQHATMRSDPFAAVLPAGRGRARSDDLTSSRPSPAAYRIASILAEHLSRGDRQGALRVLHTNFELVTNAGELADRPALAQLAAAVTRDVQARARARAGDHARAYENLLGVDGLLDGLHDALGNAAAEDAAESLWLTENWWGAEPPADLADIDHAAHWAVRRRLAARLGALTGAAHQVTGGRCSGTLSPERWLEILSELAPAEDDADLDAQRRHLHHEVERDLPF